MIAELGSFQKINDEIKSPWQQVMHAYHKLWQVFMVQYFEMHRLQWFKVNWKNTLAKPVPFCMTKCFINGGTDLPSCQ